MKDELLLGVLLGAIGGIIGSLLTGSLIAIIQLIEVNSFMLGTILFLLFLNAAMGLILFVRWITKILNG